MRAFRLPTFLYPYQKVIWSSLVSNTGTEFYRMAAAIVAFRLTGQVAAAGAAYLFSLLPRLVLLLLGGAIGDHFDRRDLLIRLDLVSVVAAGPMVLVTSAPWLPLMYTCGFVLTSLDCIYRPPQQAYLRQLAGEEQVGQAITDFMLWSVTGAQFAGPLIATSLVTFAGATTGFIANAASFAVSAALLARLPAGPRTPRPPVHVKDLLGGYSDVLHAYPRVTAICLASAAPCVPGYFFMSSAVVYATHLGQPTTFLTVLFGALAVGGFLGGMWSKHGQKHGYLNATTSGVLTLLFIPMWGLLAFTKVAWVALCLLVVIEVADAATVIVFDVFAQRAVPDHLQGRLVALTLWSFAFGEVTGALIVTCLSTSRVVGALVPVSLGSLLPLAIAGGIWVLAPQKTPLPQLEASSTAG